MKMIYVLKGTTYKSESYESRGWNIISVHSTENGAKLAMLAEVSKFCDDRSAGKDYTDMWIAEDYARVTETSSNLFDTSIDWEWEIGAFSVSN